MENNLNRLNDLLILELNSEELSGGRIGIEREGLRVSKNKLSDTLHPKILGSKLTNKFITTDFAETQLELITPPIASKKNLIDFLEELHFFVHREIEDGIWPFSMPPFIEKESDIKIADYGSSNSGLFKKIYRRGLSHRYGRFMQSISGLHLNYSFSDSLIQSILEQCSLSDDINSRSDIHLKTLRNIQKNNWLLLYFFGCSPFVSKNFSNDKLDLLSHKGSYYLPDATSLRMSELGYQNQNQSKLHVSFNTLEEYCDDLLKLTETLSNEYDRIDLFRDGKYQQLNRNCLQIEAEYYASCRPKSDLSIKGRPINILKNNGINYIELRSLDINPFSNVGIEAKTIDFLEVFFIYNCLSECTYLSSKCTEELRRNDLEVSKNGRSKFTKLLKNKSTISLYDEGSRILDGMSEISKVLGHEESFLEYFKSMLRDPSKTLSGRFALKAFEDNIEIEEFGYSLSRTNKDHFRKLNPKMQNFTEVIQSEVKRSIEEEERIQKETQLPFDKYLEEYYVSA